MFGLLKNVGGGLTGGSSGAAGGAGPQRTDTSGQVEAGTVSNGGITINEGFRFDPNNPTHLIVAGFGVVIVGGLLMKVVK